MSQRAASDSRPNLQSSKSFTRMPSSPTSTSPRKRAATIQDSGIPGIPEARHIDSSPESKKKSDVFENGGDEEEDGHAHSGTTTPNPELKLPSTFDELPIEIKSLSERFLESLSAKVHPTPLTADTLSDMFQDFYERASAHINTHIAILASRIGRIKKSSKASRTTGRARAGSGASRGDSPASGGEMLTASEVAHRKKARKLLELKRTALEEAVERGVCEKVYPRIFKHRSTDDEARDEKLRSRTAALSLVGIGLKELHGDADPGKEDLRKTAAEKEDEIHASLAEAREALQRMDDEHYPAGKLQHLTAAHKSIVETLSQIFPSSSSADEILPTLIYTLITSPPEGISVVSNLNFIQRFRASTKVDGEAAYCLVNLEAAISFLETVDLSSLRADELPEGPPKSTSDSPTQDHDRLALGQPTPARPASTSISTLSADSPALSTITSTTDSSPAAADLNKALPSPRTPPTPSTTRPPMHQRKLSSLVQAQADRIEAGRDNFLNAADKVYDSINGTLENSLQFVFGRFKDQTAVGSSPLPKTLEDARKLVNPPSPPDDPLDDGTGSGRSSPATIEDPLQTSSAPNATKMLELVGGRKQLRDRSVDSTRSGGSGKRVAFSSEIPKERTASESASAAATAAGNAGANFINAINPLGRFGVPSFPRFGRTASGSTTAILGQPSPTHEKAPPHGPGKLKDISEASPTSSTNPSATDAVEPFPPLEKQRTKDSLALVVDDGGDDEGELNAREALAELRKLKPPKKRFLEVKDSSELRVGEVEELLREFRRLARGIGVAVAL
ncbi:hypothetical protein LTR78_007082 [Recurvomyces mirabilis]|uniref:VPS9 domain-containing protein n=1 Tax=Recurvomyces mirabilis TaxID=574656 RepID=A0AAE0WJQ4_9PEZI|nr:hypothetical protein LTR78_007082 [Recurvomyces mirabilis]KAK5150946.1 hypothetical protein LTS14_009750 [Recurvomyces mirabilis]